MPIGVTQKQVRVWDLPTRIFHWSLAVSIGTAFVTAESERWRNVHVSAGYAVAALIAFRLLWGFIGGRHARFADFVRKPTKVWSYLRSLMAGRPEHYLGHNPAAAVAILLLLGSGLVTVTTGWLSYEGIGNGRLEWLHGVIANGMLVVVGVHILGVMASSWIHRENLLSAMITGRKITIPAHENSTD